MFPLVLFAVATLTTTKCHEFGNSLELNGIELSPFYETIILKDVADTLNEFDNKGFDPILKDESESEEDVEDLLSEYQHYLNKAHKQIKTYMDKSKPKNKIPLLRREKFIKPRLNLNEHQELFIPMPSRFDNAQSMSFPPKNIQEILNIPKIILEDIRPLNIPSVIDDGPRFLCPCKSSVKCDIGCPKLIPLGEKVDTSVLKLDEVPIVKQDSNDGNLNIRVNVDIEMPKILEIFGKMSKHLNQIDNLESFAPKQSNIVNLSSPFLNFPIPMRFFGSRRPKSNQQEFMPLRKITIHKKKKSKSNNCKKHHKKIITIHKLEPQRSIQSFFLQNLNLSDIGSMIANKSIYTDLDNTKINTTDEKVNSIVKINRTVAPKTNTFESTSKAESQTVNTIYLMVNISNNLDESQNLTNSVEIDQRINNTANKIAEKSIRKRRAISNDTILPSIVETNDLNTTVAFNKIVSLIGTFSKNKTTTDASDKNQTIDLPIPTQNNVTLDKAPIQLANKQKNSTYDKELLYWPISSNTPKNSSLNITSLILERENKNSKLNITKDLLLSNRTEELEHAIFGDVNWNDVDVVAPVFLSFVGKYMTGVLTFCSDQVCHSMRCADKLCVHRLCKPDERYNKIGHCTGLNSTDSEISMATIMDLPFNMAYEIVDILETKMLGQLYGKATVCIGSKCITFVATKKNFFKARCSNKDLNGVGQCTNIKNVKVL